MKVSGGASNQTERSRAAAPPAGEPERPQPHAGDPGGQGLAADNATFFLVFDPPLTPPSFEHQDAELAQSEAQRLALMADVEAQRHLVLEQEMVQRKGEVGQLCQQAANNKDR